MKYIFLYLLILVSGFGYAMAGPWWIPLLPCFVICAWRADPGWSGFLTAGLALLTLWLGYALYLDARDVTGLTVRIAELLGSGVPSLAQVPPKLLIFFVIGLVSFLLGGLSGLAGTLLRLKPKRG